MSATLFHHSFAVNDLDRARKFYGEVLQCPEGRKLKGRADFNFFGHHLVAHLAPDEVVGDKGRKIGGALAELGVEWINKPSVTQKGTVREQMLMTVSDGCGNAIEFKGLQNITDVYAVRENETITA
jgi:extradiol dioxygenase family protein